MTKHTKALYTSEGNKVWFEPEPNINCYDYKSNFAKDHSEWLSSYQLIPFAEGQRDKVVREVGEVRQWSLGWFESAIPTGVDITQFVEEKDGYLYFKPPVQINSSTHCPTCGAKCSVSDTHEYVAEGGKQDKEAMYLNMQYYMEYCQRNGYVTPQEWIEKHKHF